MSDTFRSSPERAAELAAILANYAHSCGMHAGPHRIARVVVAMQKAARSAKRRGEHACNYGLDDKQEAAQQRWHTRTETAHNLQLLELVDGGTFAAEHAPTVELGGDPRGPCAKLRVPGQRGDGFGADGFGIY